MTDVRHEFLGEFGIHVLVAEVDGMRLMAPLGSPPPEEAPRGLWLSYASSMADLKRWERRAVPDVVPCLCDPGDVFDPDDGPTPRAVEGCPAHRARYAYQQFADRLREEAGDGA